MKNFYEKNKSFIINASAVLLMIVGSYVFFKYIFAYIAPFVLGYLLSLVFSAVAEFLNKKIKLPLWLGALFSIFLLLVLCVFVLSRAAATLFYQANELYNSLPAYITDIEKALDSLYSWFASFMLTLPPFLTGIFTETDVSLSGIVSGLFASLDFTGGSVEFVKYVTNFGLVVLFSFIASFFFVTEKENIRLFIARNLSPDLLKKTERIRKGVNTALLGYFKASLILMLLNFVICLLGFLVLGSPYALLLAISTSVIDALPVFGSGFILWPGAIINLILGNANLAIGYMAIYIIVQLVRQVVQPKIIANQIGLPPLIALFSMYVGYRLLGILGMLMGPIIASVILIVSDMMKGGALSEEAIRLNLSPEYSTLPITVLDTVNSTNTYAKKLVRERAPDRSIITANEQTAGRGRQGKSFYSPAGGVYASIILRPDVNKPDIRSLLTITAAVAAARAIEKYAAGEVKIKWVNDILINGKKVCGILTEAMSDDNAYIVGIGVNINTQSFPEDISSIAASIKNENISRSVLIAEMSSILFSLLDSSSDEEILEEYKRRSFVIGRKVFYTKNGQSFSGVPVDINFSGNLIVKTDAGTEVLDSGEISLKL